MTADVVCASMPSASGSFLVIVCMSIAKNRVQRRSHHVNTPAMKTLKRDAYSAGSTDEMLC